MFWDRQPLEDHHIASTFQSVLTLLNIFWWFDKPTDFYYYAELVSAALSEATFRLCTLVVGRTFGEPEIQVSRFSGFVESCEISRRFVKSSNDWIVLDSVGSMKMQYSENIFLLYLYLINNFRTKCITAYHKDRIWRSWVFHHLTFGNRSRVTNHVRNSHHVNVPKPFEGCRQYGMQMSLSKKPDNRVLKPNVNEQVTIDWPGSDERLTRKRFNISSDNREPNLSVPCPWLFWSYLV